MNTQRIDFEDRIQQNHELIGDYPNHSSHYLGDQQSSNMGIRTHPPVSDPGFQHHHQSLRPDKSCNSIMSRFESPASAFYATERYMGFQEHDGLVSSPSMCSLQYSKSYDSGIPSQHSFGKSYSVDSGEKTDNMGFRGSFNSITSDKYYDNPCKRFSIPCFGDESKRLLGKEDASFRTPFSACLQGIQDHQVGYNPQVSHYARIGFLSGPENSSPRYSSGSVSMIPGNSASAATALASKTRIRWTQDLHEKFVECVNRLGGAEKATPKAILKLMDTDGLTIFHVKSHLQKYRIAKYMPDSSEGRMEKRGGITDVSQIDPKTGFQLREALQLQLDVQRRLHEQLEIQRNLQFRIEEQGRQLKMMFDQQQNKSKGLLKNQNLETASQESPTLCLEDFEVSTVEGSNNTHFPSKIS